MNYWKVNEDKIIDRKTPLHFFFGVILGGICKAITGDRGHGYIIGSAVTPTSDFLLHKITGRKTDFHTRNGMADLFFSNLGVLIGTLAIDKIAELYRKYISRK